MLSLLKIEYTKEIVDLASGEHKTEEFLKLNPFAQVPVLETKDLIIRDSVAIIAYLAKKYGPEWYPNDPVVSARIQEWLALSASGILTGPGRARLIEVFGAKFNQKEVVQESHTVLKKINNLISESEWLVGDKPSIADIACYTYVAHAPEGRVSLDGYPNILRWLKNVESLENFVGMQKTPLDD